MAKKTFKIKDNLAEALDDTVASAKNNAGELHIEVIPLRKISLDPDNPRELILGFNDLHEGALNNDVEKEKKILEIEQLNSLANSIKEQGVINPIVVYKHNDQYRLIAGERRTLASILAKKEDIPARILTSKPDPLKLSLIQWIENIEREDLSLWERMRNLEKILNAYAEIKKKENIEVSPTEISQLTGCSLSQALNYRHILNASEELRKYIQNGKMQNIEKVAFIAKAPTETQDILIQACLNGATLSELKKHFTEPSISNKVKRGRPPTKINLGSIQNSKVAKTIIDTVLFHKNFQHLSNKFSDIRWDDNKSIALAFKRLIKLIEQE